MTKTVTILGGGVWVSVFCASLARTALCAAVELRLVARNRDRLTTISADADARVKASKPGWRVVAMPEEQALDGADIIIVMLRAGGLDARRVDETFPHAFGVEGDEGLGLGGMANALRTIPLMRRIGRRIVARSPDALVLNLVAPLGLATRALLAEGVDALGVCELPVVAEAAMARHVAGPLDYIGLNHLGWFWPRGRSFSDAEIAALETAGLAARPVVAHFGAAPLKYHYRLFDQAAGARIGVHPPKARAEALRSASEEILTVMQRAPGGEITTLASRDMPWLSHALTPICAAALDGGTPWGDFANVANRGREPLLSNDLIVELRQSRPTRKSEPPEKVRAVVQGFAQCETHVWRAHLAEDPIAELVSAISAMPFGRGNAPEGRQAEAVHDASRAIMV